MSIELTLDASLPNAAGSPTDFLVSFFPPIDLGSLDYAVALLHLDTWFTTFNIHNSNNSTIVYSPNAGVTQYVVPIPDGNYSIQDLNALLQTSQRDNLLTAVDPVTGSILYGVQLLPNFNTNRAIIDIQDSVPFGGWELILTGPNALYPILGFNPGIYTTTTESQNIPNFNDGVNQWQVRTDLIRNSYSNGVQQPIIFNFVPLVPPSAHITVTPYQLNYLQVNKSLINQIRIQLTDQNGTVLNLNNNLCTVTLKIKKIGQAD